MDINWNRLLQPDLIWVIIPVTGIVVGGVIAILGQIHKHRERQAMIDQGIHPDYPPDDPSRGSARDKPSSREYRT